ncbi:MAG: C69 family dipeptidase [Acidobacteriia bacterium]|nr:C69 family dipeptidase [Terriglobia bacterium]
MHPERPMRRSVPIAIAFLLLISLASAPAPQVQSPDSESCTSILVGKLASADGSTMTSHSCDSGSDRTWMNIVPRQKHGAGERAKVWLEPKLTKGPDDTDRVPTGEIPQVAETYKYLNAAYPIMNEHQLAIGETTTGGKRELQSKEGIIDAPELYRLILERARTAREAIQVADELTRKYGYNDAGECFTFADPNEVWHFEILGPGRGKVGAVWAAVRIPDDQIGVSANAHRIRQLDLKNKDYYMASDNVLALAQEMGWWDPKSGHPFEFCYAYADRSSMGSRRREWRVLSLLAPSLRLDPNAENYPLSVKPDKKVSVQDVLAIFRDSYDATPFDMTRNLTVVNQQGQAVKSPVANPFMNSDWTSLFRIQRERTICSPTATYLQITQSRSWLPNPIGGLVWLGYDNPATTPHMPFYIGISQMPESFMIDGREKYRRDCAWWAFRQASKLSYIRYQVMKEDLKRVWQPIEADAFAKQKATEDEALRLYQTDPAKAGEYLTKYCHGIANKAVEDYWKVGELLWSKYNNSF